MKKFRVLSAATERQIGLFTIALVGLLLILLIARAHVYVRAQLASPYEAYSGVTQ